VISVNDDFSNTEGAGLALRTRPEEMTR